MRVRPERHRYTCERYAHTGIATNPRISSGVEASKYMGELVMSTNDGLYGLPTLSLRFFMVYGPRNPSEGAYAIVTGAACER